MRFSRLLTRRPLNLQNIRRVDPIMSVQSDPHGLDVPHRTIFIVDDDKFRKFEEWLNSPFQGDLGTRGLQAVKAPWVNQHTSSS